MQPILIFLLTFFVELIVYFIFLKEKKEQIILYCFLINLFTWPLAILLYHFKPELFYFIEFFVFLIESILIMLLFKINWKKALLISFIANFITAFIGLLIIATLFVYTSL